ncbi:MAG TPA: hypothetical protein VN277_05155 [Acidiferrobacterales bacterium]|nr:hypothetical protein [Acidiferrobacterales bacterium]
MWKYLWVMLLVLLMTGCAAHTVTSGRVVIRDDRAVVEARFSDRDRAIMEEYYRAAKPKKTQPGLAKRELLPPGLARRDTLPPGLQGRLLPRELEARLTILPAAQVRVMIGRDIVLMQRDTRVVLDILYGVVD